MPLSPRWHLFGRRRHQEAALDDELNACVEILTRQKQAEGLSFAAARREALIELGGVAQAKEHVRATWPGRWAVGVARDARHAVRSVTSHRVASLTAVLSLALGIGAVTAVYSWGSAVFYRWPAGVPEPDRVLSVMVDDREGPADPNVVAPTHIRELREATRNVFSGMDGAFRAWLSLNADRPAQESTVEFVTGGFFSTVGVPLRIGRGIEAGDDRPGSERVVVLSHRMWQQLFSSSPDVLGRAVRLNGQTCVVVGVASAAFEGLEYSLYGTPSLWAASQTFSSIVSPMNDRSSRFRVIARLRSGVPPAAAAEALDLAGQSLSYDTTDYRRYTKAIAMPLTSTRIPSYTQETMRGYFTVLMTVTVLILCAGCINIANLLLGQGVARAQEMGIRLALGATRRQLFQQLILECTLLGAAGGACGLAVAYFVAGLLEKYPPVNGLGSILRTPAPIDLRAAVVAWVIAGIATMLFGLVPAVMTSMRSPLAGLMGARWSSGRGVRLRQSLLALQVAFAVVISVVSALEAQSLLRMNRLALPYAAESTLLARIGADALSPSQRTAFYASLLSAVRAQPDVVAAGVAYNPLLAVGSARVQRDSGIPPVPADFSTIGAGFFGAMAIPIVAGRDFRDDEADATVTVINRVLADRLWPGESAIGRSVGFASMAPGKQFTVIGVVDQPRCQDRMLNPSPCVYWPLRPARPGAYNLHVRTHGEPHAFIPVLRRLATSLNADVVVDRTLTLDEHLDQLRTGPRVTAVATVVTAALASILSAIGACALLFTLLNEARREIAIRVALGSTRQRIVQLFMQRALAPYIAGAVVGVAAAWWATLQVSASLFATEAHEVGAFVWPVVALLTLGLVSSYWLTRSASDVRPWDVLRS